jgi:hypothetical protein
VSSHYLSAHYGPSHYGSSHYGRLAVVPIEEEQVHPPGMGRRKQIMDEDEMIMAIIIAFLETRR